VEPPYLHTRDRNAEVGVRLASVPVSAGRNGVLVRAVARAGLNFAPG
jgi:hypothetical protein